MAFARSLYINPANPAQRYILYTSGVIEARGGALAVPQTEASVNTDNGTDAPTFHGWAGQDIAKALFITDWAGPSGYTLTAYGHVWSWGAAAAVPGAANHYLPGTAPEFYFGLNGGFASPDIGFVNDFVMDPAGNGRGYYLKYDGDAIAFGTGVTGIAHSAVVAGSTVAVRIVMDWTSKRYWVLDALGRVWGLNGGNNVGVAGQAALALINKNYGRGLVLYDKSATPKGWMEDAYGIVRRVGAAVTPTGYKTLPYDWSFQDLGIIDDGTGANPLRLAQMDYWGGLTEFVSSTAPALVVVSPTGTVTLTTRPYVPWTYTDAENNPQKTYQVRVFNSTQYGIGGFDPATSPATWETSGTDAAVRRVQIGVDLPNATYRAYVRVTDTSDLASAWVNTQWIQSVTAPVAPVLAASSLGGLSGVALTATGAASYNGLVLDGSSGAWASTPDIAAWTAAGVLRWVARIRASDYTRAADQVIIGQYVNTGNQRAHLFAVTTAGALRLDISSNGTTNAFTQASSAPAFVDGTAYWVGVEYNTATGALTYYKAADAEAQPALWAGFTQISTHTVAAAAPFASTGALGIGAIDAGVTARFFGSIIRAQFIDDGVTIANPDFSANGSPLAVTGASTYTDSTGKVWTLGGTASILVPGGTRAGVQYHDSDWNGTTWEWVRGADALVPDITGIALGTDYGARFGIVRSYRALTYIYDATTDTFTASGYSNTVTATLGPQNMWTLQDEYNVITGVQIRANVGFAPAHTNNSTTFYGTGRRDPIVLSDGAPKFPKFKLEMWALDNTARAQLEDLLEADTVLLLKDPLGRSWDFKLVDDLVYSMLRATPKQGETTSVRDAHLVTVSAQAIKRPLAGPSTGPLAVV